MKTLDEVITELKTIYDRYEAEGCFYCSFLRECTGGYCYLADALNYLKEFQGLSKMWNDKLDKEQANPPLTMEEFSRKIDTEPIWCQELQEWYLFLAYDDGDNRIQLMTDKGDIETFDEDDLEKYPLYRRK